MHQHFVLILTPYGVSIEGLEACLQGLKDFQIGFSVRAVSPEGAPDHLLQILEQFHQGADDLIYCWECEGSMELTRYVAARTERPVLTLSAGDRAAIPLGLKILACKDPLLREELRRQRLSLAVHVLEADRQLIKAYQIGES